MIGTTTSHGKTIVHIVAYFQPELGYQEHFLAREMATAGHNVHMVTSNRFHPFTNFDQTAGKVLGSRFTEAGTSQRDGYTVHRLPLKWEYHNRVIVSGLSKTLKELSPDLVILHGTTNRIVCESEAVAGDEAQCAQSVTCDELLSGRRYSAAKVDVEGAELSVLCGAKQMLSENNPPVWILEFKERLLKTYGCTASDLAAYLRNQGYEFAIYDPDKREIVRHDDPCQDTENVIVVARERWDEVVTRLATSKSY